MVPGMPAWSFLVENGGRLDRAAVELGMRLGVTLGTLRERTQLCEINDVPADCVEAFVAVGQFVHRAVLVGPSDTEGCVSVIYLPARSYRQN